jgi:hypothetical protein
MATQLDIPDSQLPKFREIYTNMAQDILDRLASAQREWEDIQPILGQLGIKLGTEGKKTRSRSTEPLIAPIDLSLGYDKNWSWAKKAAYVITIKGKALSAKEIIDILETEFEPTIDRVKAGNSLPSTLSVESTRNNKFSRTNLNGEYIYDVIK